MITIVIASAALLASPVGAAIVEEVLDTPTRKRIKRFMDYKRTGAWPVTAPSLVVTQEAPVKKDRTEVREFTQKWDDAYTWFSYGEEIRQMLIRCYMDRKDMAKETTNMVHSAKQGVDNARNPEVRRLFIKARLDAHKAQALALEALRIRDDAFKVHEVYLRMHHHANELIMLEA